MSRGLYTSLELTYLIFKISYKTSMSNYIVDATSILTNAINKNRIDAIATDLSLIKQKIPKINNIVLRGGAALDAIYNLDPNDVDLFYCHNDSSRENSSECICDDLRIKLDSLAFNYFDKSTIDLENSFEKEPKLNPIDRTVGYFSYHTEYNSQFVIDNKGRIWTNKDALNFHLKNIYEVRFEGFFPWANFPREGDSKNYFAFHTNIIIRAISYINKRNLTPGPKTLLLLENANYILEKSIDVKGLDYFKLYALSKIKSKEKLQQFIEKFMNESKYSTANEILVKLFE